MTFNRQKIREENYTQKLYELISNHPELEEEYNNLVFNGKNPQNLLPELEQLVNKYNSSETLIQQTSLDEIIFLRQEFLKDMIKYNSLLEENYSFEINSEFDAYKIVKNFNDHSLTAGYLLCVYPDDNLELELAEGYISPSFRREGLFKKSIEFAIEKYNRNYDITAYVFKGNYIPQKVLLDLGFEKTNIVENNLIKFIRRR